MHIFSIRDKEYIHYTHGDSEYLSWYAVRFKLTQKFKQIKKSIFLEERKDNGFKYKERVPSYSIFVVYRLCNGNRYILCWFCG